MLSFKKVILMRLAECTALKRSFTSLVSFCWFSHSLFRQLLDSYQSGFLRDMRGLLFHDLPFECRHVHRGHDSDLWA